MNAAGIIQLAEKIGIKFELNGEKLRFTGPRSIVADPEFLADVTKNIHELRDRVAWHEAQQAIEKEKCVESKK